MTTFHSHTHYCDGTHPPEVYVQKAIELGLKQYGFSSHAPLNYDIKWCMPMSRRFEYVNEIRALKEKYAAQIDIYCGMEVDFIPNEAGTQAPWIKELGLDYSVGSVHLVGFENAETPWEIDGPHEVFKRGLKTVFDNDIQAAVIRYFQLTRQMLVEDKPTILGHLDKIKMHNTTLEYFKEDEKWYKDAMMETLEVASKTGIIIELNTRGIYKKKTHDTYPSNWVVKEMASLKIPVIVNSDCHHPSEMILGYDVAFENLKSAGITETVLYG